MSGKKEYPLPSSEAITAAKQISGSPQPISPPRRLIAGYQLCRHAGIASPSPEVLARIEAEIREMLAGKRVLVDLPPGFSLEPIERDV